MNAFDAAGTSGGSAELLAELDALFTGQNVSASADTTSIPAAFLRVTVAASLNPHACPEGDAQ